MQLPTDIVVQILIQTSCRAMKNWCRASKQVYTVYSKYLPFICRQRLAREYGYWPKPIEDDPVSHYRKLVSNQGQLYHHRKLVSNQSHLYHRLKKDTFTIPGDQLPVGTPVWIIWGVIYYRETEAILPLQAKVSLETAHRFVRQWLLTTTKDVTRSSVVARLNHEWLTTWPEAIDLVLLLDGREDKHLCIDCLSHTRYVEIFIVCEKLTWCFFRKKTR